MPGLDCIVAEALPEEGLGVAIMDRLRRAAHAARFVSEAPRQRALVSRHDRPPAVKSRSDLQDALALMRQAGANETSEKRVRLVRFALEFRMILAGEEKRVVAQLDQLRERAVG